ncbi:MAG: DUF1850 domain-containing protein [Desulfobacteraceae bacterium]|nr:DUF1850 domain-containing protein [Desulfobacteraceae bacterium]
MKLIIAGVLALLLLACCSPISSAGLDTEGFLVIAEFPEQRKLAQYRLGGNKTFTLSFIHSVSKTRVTDVYEIQTGQIVQIKELFKDHGAGLPSNPDEPGGLYWEKDKDQFILHMKRPIPKLVVRTDKNYQNRLTLGSVTVDLNQWEDQALFIYIDSGISN